MTHDYKHNGTTTRFAVLNGADIGLNRLLPALK